MAHRIQVRRDTATNWTSVNPILASGEIGFEKDTNKVKIGDGMTGWNALSYLIISSSGGVEIVSYPPGGPWPDRPDTPSPIIWNSLDPSAGDPSGGLTNDIILLPKIEPLLYALSDESTAISTTSTALVVRAPFNITLTNIRLSLKTPSSSGVVRVSMLVDSVDFFTTMPSVNSGSKTSVGATTPHVFAHTFIDDDSEIIFGIDLAGTGAVGLKATLYGYQS